MPAALSKQALGLSILIVFTIGTFASAQRVVPSKLLPGGQSLQHGMMEPGRIGAERMMVRPEMAGYRQPIRFVLPQGAVVSVWDGSKYQPLDTTASIVRMQLGAIYRLKITNVPNRPGGELFPSIEVINRLHPPEGQADQFPIEVHLTQKELERAIAGQYVMRVTYLEDPETALPIAQAPGDQSYTQVSANEDPLHVAASLGRPLTIVRMGSRIPLSNEVSNFELGQAPLEVVNRTFSNGLVPSSEFQASNETGQIRLTSAASGVAHTFNDESRNPTDGVATGSQPVHSADHQQVGDQNVTGRNR